MAIVKFEQDATANYGTGNFTDEAGRTMYLADPDTARRFVPTLPGQKVGAAPAAESISQQSTNIATQAMGAAAPQKGPDLRLASASASQPAPDVVALEAAVTAHEQGKKTSGPAALVGALDQLSPPPGSPPPGNAPQGAPAPGAGPPGGPQTPLDKAKAYIALGTAPARRSPTAAAPAPPGASSLPVSGSQSSWSTSTAKGADKQNAQARIHRQEAFGSELDDTLADQARTKDLRAEQAIGGEQRGLQTSAIADVQRGFDEKRKQQEAEEHKKRLAAELKANDESLDPDRVVRQMSTGKQIGMVILAALNGGFGAIIGKKENGVLRVLDLHIERDIDKQKQEISAGRVRIGNQLDQYIKKGFDAETAEKLYRDKLHASVSDMLALEKQRLGLEGANAEQADLLIGQRREQRVKEQGEIWATTEDRAQTQSSGSVTRQAMQSANPAESRLKEMELELKAIQLGNAKLEVMDAAEMGKIIYGVDKEGHPKRMPSPEQAKALKDKVASVGPAFAETAGAVNMTKDLVEELGGKLDESTGKITWAGEVRDASGKVVSADISGAGPVDAAGGAWAVNPVTGLPVHIARKLNLYRADVDKVRDRQAQLKEYVTSVMTGANSSLKQDKTFGAMVGGDLSNEDQVRQSVESWAQTLFAARTAHATRLGDDGLKLHQHNAAGAKQGVGAPPPTARIPEGS